MSRRYDTRSGKVPAAHSAGITKATKKTIPLPAQPARPKPPSAPATKAAQHYKLQISRASSSPSRMDLLAGSSPSSRRNSMTPPLQAAPNPSSGLRAFSPSSFRGRTPLPYGPMTDEDLELSPGKTPRRLSDSDKYIKPDTPWNLPIPTIERGGSPMSAMSGAFSNMAVGNSSRAPSKREGSSGGNSQHGSASPKKECKGKGKMLQ